MLTFADPQKLLTRHPETIQIAVHQSVKKCPSIRLRTEGLGLSAEHFCRNIAFLRGSCRLAFGKSQDGYYVFTTVAKDRKRAVPN
jgi:hypothetical protein